MSEPFEVSMERVDGFRFDVDLGVPGGPALRMDEPPPLGAGGGPNAARLLAAAVGHCLSASALYCLEKARIPVLGMSTTVRASLERNERGRVRVGRIEVTVSPTVAEDDRGRIGRCLGLFEDFCIVTQSVRAGVDIAVDVEPVSPDAPLEVSTIGTPATFSGT